MNRRNLVRFTSATKCIPTLAVFVVVFVATTIFPTKPASAADCIQPAGNSATLHAAPTGNSRHYGDSMEVPHKP